MILADKIIDLRKKNGWSQEELAAQLGVSRQAVSKWESASSIPDLDKVIKLSGLFGVSTDYLLRDSMGEPEPEEEQVFESGQEIREISMEEVNHYMEAVRETAGIIAAGVSLCILSPVSMILLLGLAEAGGLAFSENAAVAAGVSVLLLMVSCAVALFVIWGKKLEAWEYLEAEPIELSYGVKGAVEKKKSEYAPTHSITLAVGIPLCIVSAVPIFMGAALDDGSAVLTGVCVCLCLVAAGTFLLVKTGMVYESFQKLLEEGEYTRMEKKHKKRDEILAGIYWCCVTAVYLGWSFYTMGWERTWIIWPCSAVLYGAVCGIAALAGRK